MYVILIHLKIRCYRIILKLKRIEKFAFIESHFLLLVALLIVLVSSTSLQIRFYLTAIVFQKIDHDRLNFSPIAVAQVIRLSTEMTSSSWR